MSGDFLTVEVPGLAVVALDLDDAGQWPGLRVSAWTKKGRGYTATCVGHVAVFQNLLYHIGHDKLPLNASQRQAVGRAATLVRQAILSCVE